MNSIDTEKIFFRLLYILKRLTDNWADNRLAGILPGFKTAYLPVLMCINDTGISNSEIARELHISKMAASKMVKELLKLELITAKKDLTDARSDILQLSDSGEKLLGEIRSLSNGLINEYEIILGKKNYQKMIDSMAVIQHYHESTPLEGPNKNKQKNIV